MLRFLSKRKDRNNGTQNGNQQNKNQRPINKNILQCKVILLDGSDLSVDLPVSFDVICCVFLFVFVIVCRPLLHLSYYIKYIFYNYKKLLKQLYVFYL